MIGDTNEGNLAADGPQQQVPLFQLPPVETVTTDDGRSVPQYADMVLAQSTWPGAEFLQ